MEIVRISDAVHQIRLLLKMNEKEFNVVRQHRIKHKKMKFEILNGRSYYIYAATKTPDGFYLLILKDQKMFTSIGN
jgi:hypothetical protein